MIVRICHIFLSMCLLFSILCLLERPAHAYVDPGSGLLAFQAFSALVAGAVFSVRRRVRHLLRLFRATENRADPSL
jgi:hypothetical protein